VIKIRRKNIFARKNVKGCRIRQKATPRQAGVNGLPAFGGAEGDQGSWAITCCMYFWFKI